MVRTHPGVTRDAQERQGHLEWQTSINRTKCTFSVGEVAGIFPQEVADKRFGGIFVARDLQEKVLEFSRDTPDVKDTISPFHSLQIDANHAQSLCEEEVGGCGITVNE